MMKLIVLGSLALVEAVLTTKSGASLLQQNLKTESLAEHTKAQIRATEAVKSMFARNAARLGKTYEQYITGGDDDDDNTSDDNDVGSDALEHRLMDEDPTIGVHQFTEIHDEDPVEPDAYEGEDTAAIDANDAATNYGDSDDDSEDTSLAMQGEEADD